MMKKWTMLLILSVMLVQVVSAQEGGQICVQSFEDRNGNQQQDSGEPYITQGISAILTDANGISVESAKLAQSANAAQGIMCFQYLAAGTYTVNVATADYTPITDSSFVATITDSTVPVQFDFGVQLFQLPTDEQGANSPLSTDQQQARVRRLLLAFAGAVMVMSMMAFLGFVLYAFVFRRRLRRFDRLGGITGGMRPVTGAFAPITTDTGTMAAVKTETGMMPPVQPGSATATELTPPVTPDEE